MAIGPNLATQTLNNVNQGQTASGLIGVLNTPVGALTVNPRPPAMNFDFHKAGHRVPSINRKLGVLYEKTITKHISTADGYFEFYFIHQATAVDVLGGYNPMHAKRPKRLALCLLDALVPRRPKANRYIKQSGLTYHYPGLIGVRAAKERTSAAGLALLEHWAETFPPFKPFLDAYMTKKVREEILVECYDLLHEVLPTSFQKLEKLNETYKIKWEAREYRRMKKEEQQAEEATKKSAMVQILAKQQSASALVQVLNNSVLRSTAIPPLWKTP